MVTTQQVIDAQVHLWSLKNESHPKTSQYWAEVTNGLVVINPEIIANQINALHDKLAEAKKRRKRNLGCFWKENVCSRFRGTLKKTLIFFLKLQDSWMIPYKFWYIQEKNW